MWSVYEWRNSCNYAKHAATALLFVYNLFRVDDVAPRTSVVSSE
jgi:hypothetical protein